MMINILPNKLIICITFHYVHERLKYLDIITNTLNQLANEVLVIIVTNTNSEQNKYEICNIIQNKGFQFEIHTPALLGHPYLLTWAHYSIIKDIIQDSTFTHFMYLEDDILIKKENMEYWMEGRELLKPFNCYPSFLRVEKKLEDDEKWYSSDARAHWDISQFPFLSVAKDYVFITPQHPYQGMYLYDRELMLEHLNGPSYSPELKLPFDTLIGIRERANIGLSFTGVNEGKTRNLIGFNPISNSVDKRCLIHHTPNNYVNMPGYQWISIDELFIGSISN